MSRQFASLIGRGRVRAAATAGLLLVVGLLASSLGAGPSGAATQPTLEVSVSTDNSALQGALGAPTTAIPTVLAAKNQTSIRVTIRVIDGSDLNKGTVVTLTPVGTAANTPTGIFKLATFTWPSKGSTASFTVTYTAADDNIALLAALKKTPSVWGQSASFDVVESLILTKQGDIPTTGLGTETCNTKTNTSVCGVVVLPEGIGSDNAAMSSGGCSDTLCTPGGKEVQFIAGLKRLVNPDDPDTLENIYSKTNPATLLLQCDKSQCAGKGVSSYTAKVSLSATADLKVSPACTSKGVIQNDPTVDFCTDYVSSKRNNAGDLILVVLFFTDMRATI
jgi:hypothetical protein